MRSTCRLVACDTLSLSFVLRALAKRTIEQAFWKGGLTELAEVVDLYYVQIVVCWKNKLLQNGSLCIEHYEFQFFMVSFVGIYIGLIRWVQRRDLVRKYSAGLNFTYLGLTLYDILYSDFFFLLEVNSQCHNYNVHSLFLAWFFIMFMLTQGDFLVHFMDIARDELAKKPDEVSVEKLQV